jgi:hypothetical protein
MERVTGPWHGLFVAAYTTQFKDAFYGYCKLYASAPEDPFSEGPVLKLGTRAFSCEPDALQAAVRRGIGAAAEFAASRNPEYWANLVEAVSVAANDPAPKDTSDHDMV